MATAANMEEGLQAFLRGRGVPAGSVEIFRVAGAVEIIPRGADIGAADEVRRQLSAINDFPPGASISPGWVRVSPEAPFHTPLTESLGTAGPAGRPFVPDAVAEAVADQLEKIGRFHHWWPEGPGWREMDPIGQSEFLGLAAELAQAAFLSADALLGQRQARQQDPETPPVPF